jgi:NTE family protein
MEKIGLALGSGGARGYAHIGVIKALEEENWKPEVITGSSIGALVAVFYSYYQDIEKVEDLMHDGYWREMFDMFKPSLRSGVIPGKKVESFLEEFIGEIDLSDLSIPVGVVATDFKTSQPVLIRKGRASQAVHGSLAFPFFIEPLETADRILWDGGLSIQIPTGSARQMGANRVIAVDLNQSPEDSNDSYKEMNPYEIGIKAIRSLQLQMVKMSMTQADIEISPELDPTVLLGMGTLLKKGEGKKIIDKGYKETKKVIQCIKEN